MPKSYRPRPRNQYGLAKNEGVTLTEKYEGTGKYLRRDQIPPKALPFLKLRDEVDNELADLHDALRLGRVTRSQFDSAVIRLNRARFAADARFREVLRAILSPPRKGRRF